MNQELKRQILNNPKYRRPYMAKNFYRYCRFYYPQYYTFSTPAFLMPVYKAMEEWKNVFMKTFRNSAKTTLTQMYVNNCVSQRKRRHIMRYSDTGESSEENLMYVANSLIENERFITDYGQLYYDENAGKYSGKTIKGKKKFITENEVLLAGMSMGMSPRGKNYTAKDGKFRPDLLVFDDIDTIRSTRSKKMIDKNMEFFLNEILWGTTQATQLIVLGNTIYEDGMIPRIQEHFKDDPSWLIVEQPIYDKEWKIVWDRFVETDAEALIKNEGILNPHRRFISLESERRRLGTISFGQNYLLIPYVRGMVIVQRHLINKLDCKDFYFDKIRIGLDTAISKKQESDRVAFTVTWYDKWKKYVCESVKLEWESKRMPNQIKLAKDLYEKRWKQTDNIMLNVETVAFQEVLADYLKEEKLAVNTIKTHKDKVTRMLEYQGDFEAGNVFFNTTGCDELIEELIAFPNWEYDDMVDSMMMAFNDDHDEWLMESA